MFHKVVIQIVHFFLTSVCKYILNVKSLYLKIFHILNIN
jgi:hypothetical protein